MRMISLHGRSAIAVVAIAATMGLATQAFAWGSSGGGGGGGHGGNQPNPCAALDRNSFAEIGMSDTIFLAQVPCPTKKVTDEDRKKMRRVKDLLKRMLSDERLREKGHQLPPAENAKFRDKLASEGLEVDNLRKELTKDAGDPEYDTWNKEIDKLEKQEMDQVLRLNATHR